MNAAWPEGIYIKTKIGDLILVALSGFKDKEVSFENLLERCFSLFPNRFSFLEHTEWPDARRLGRPLRLLREDGLVGGSRDGFIIMKKGREVAAQALRLLKQGRLGI